MYRFPRTLLLSLGFAVSFPIAFGTGACSSTDTTPAGDAGSGGTDAPAGGDVSVPEDSGGATDGATNDGTATDSGSEGGTCTQGVVKPANGETCVGFGKKSPCNAACGEYGYLCFVGGPPNFTKCLQVSKTAFGDTYCCTENKCVAEPDQDAMCAGAPGKPHRYQCPPDGAGGNVAPPANCEEKGSGSTELEKFYCCP